ncbi:uncharacterized protein [Montipora capricornis]|uniref:uncharacterized protein isoform X2 n=1 Tax=Montipora capricornis TaxID=246305 RepID=UPI0035F12408
MKSIWRLRLSHLVGSAQYREERIHSDITRGSSSNLNISELGQSFKYECTCDAAVGNSPDFQGLCFSVATPGNKSQDLVCLKPGAHIDSSGCLRVDPPLYDCCQKNIKQMYFHTRGDGSGKFVLVTKYGPISSCDDTNNCKFTISSKTGGLTSSQVICTIKSTGTEISSTSNPPLISMASIAHNKTEGDVTRTVSPGTTNHAVAGTSNKGIMMVTIVTCTMIPFILVKLLYESS